MTNEMPSFATSTYASSTLSNNDWENGPRAAPFNTRRAQSPGPVIEHLQKQNEKPKGEPMSVLRVVQVFIADVDTNVPLENRVLYKGEAKATDATDQELFFEIDIRGLLEKHNKERVAYVNKSVKDRTEYLEPARVRDLKMTVVNIASF